MCTVIQVEVEKYQSKSEDRVQELRSQVTQLENQCDQLQTDCDQLKNTKSNLQQQVRASKYTN